MLNFTRSQNITFYHFLINCRLWGRSACCGSIRRVKLVWTQPAQAYNLTSEVNISQNYSTTVENQVFGAVPHEIPEYSYIFLIGSA